MTLEDSIHGLRLRAMQRAPASGLPAVGPHASGALPGRSSLMAPALGSGKCQHRYEAGQTGACRTANSPPITP
jgi:hypothetical protein